jgi:hypothetical protein
LLAQLDESLSHSLRVALPSVTRADHQSMFEAWNGEPFAHGHEHFELRVQLAVVDAATAP